MVTALVLAALLKPDAAFLTDFGGSWVCGAGRAREAWRIAPHAGPAVPGAALADVAYGPAAHPDGLAFVYYDPGERAFRYDDFHADGSQSHLRATRPEGARWTWTGTYYPQDAAPQPGVVITWTRRGDAIVRRFAQRSATGALVDHGSDRCTPVGGAS